MATELHIAQRKGYTQVEGNFDGEDLTINDVTLRPVREYTNNIAMETSTALAVVSNGKLFTEVYNILPFHCDDGSVTANLEFVNWNVYYNPNNQRHWAYVETNAGIYVLYKNEMTSGNWVLSTCKPPLDKKLNEKQKKGYEYKETKKFNFKTYNF